MAGALYQLALIVKKPNADQFQFLVIRQKRPVPEKFDGLPYVDRELWDLPLSPLSKTNGSNGITMSPLTEDDDGSLNVTRSVTNSIHKLGLSGFNVGEAVTQVRVCEHRYHTFLTGFLKWKFTNTSWSFFCRKPECMKI